LQLLYETSNCVAGIVSVLVSINHPSIKLMAVKGSSRLSWPEKVLFFIIDTCM
jgi:hypothetical protein